MEALTTIKNSIKKELPDARVILFGSYARGQQNNDSDIDVLVITKQQLSQNLKMHYRSLLRKQLVKMLIPAEVLLMSEGEVENKKNLHGHIVKTIVEEGKEL